MREATYLDMLGLIHYALLLIFILIIATEVYFYKRARAKKKRVSTILMSFIFFGTLFLGLVVRAYVFPGGGLHDTKYAADRAYINMIQSFIESYKEHCKAYPTTAQGLKALAEKPADTDCTNYKSSMRNPIKDLNYFSDGQTYALESTREYYIPKLFIRATNGARPQYYIRETEKQ